MVMEDPRDQISSNNNTDPQTKILSHEKKPTWLIIVFLVALPVLLAIVLLSISMTVPEIHPKVPGPTKCILSVQANKSGLSKFFKDLQDVYFQELHPERIATRPAVTTAEVRQFFLPYDPKPSSIKRRTKRAEKLLQELEKIKYNETELKLRERVAYYIARNILRHNFGWAPQTQNYYVADWMIGPDTFCWEPICDLVGILAITLPHFAPGNFSDAVKLREMLMKHNETVEQYIENLRTGVNAGMVRSRDGCDDGGHAIKYVKYESITLKGEKGILDTPLAAILKGEFFQHLSAADNKTWREVYGKYIGEYFIDSLINYVGRPINKLLLFLDNEYSRHCVDPSLVSGFGTLPLSFVYMDGNPDMSKPAKQELPDGTLLNGPNSYKRVMSFFTSTLITPEELREKAWNRLQEVYQEAVDIAKKYTRQDDDNTAVSVFKTELLKKDRSFNSEAFPVSESDEKAYIECRNDELAKKNCPERWKIMQEWIESTKKTMDHIRPKLDSLFYFTGSKKTTPDCPIHVQPWYSPVATYHIYITGMSSDCSGAEIQGLPFFVEKFGPKYTEWTTTAHEQLPGHHLEVQGYYERFLDTCGDTVGWLFPMDYFPAFTEGWATYVEGRLLPRDTGLYSNTNDRDILIQKYGMVHYQILVALRAVVDIDLNYNGKDRDHAMKLYEQYAWQDNTHMAKQDVKRYQSIPGFSTSYILGEMEISRVRAIAEKELGSEFSLKEFHYQLLRFGEYPLDYMEKYFRYYINCKKGSGSKSPGCIEALS